MFLEDVWRENKRCVLRGVITPVRPRTDIWKGETVELTWAARAHQVSIWCPGSDEVQVSCPSSVDRIRSSVLTETVSIQKMNINCFDSCQILLSLQFLWNTDMIWRRNSPSDVITPQFSSFLLHVHQPSEPQMKQRTLPYLETVNVKTVGEAPPAAAQQEPQACLISSSAPALTPLTDGAPRRKRADRAPPLIRR